MYCYDDTQPKAPYRGGSPYNIDPHKPYLTHLQNQFYLEFLSSHKDSTLDERFQAEKELKICHKKLDYWSRMPNFDPKRMVPVIDKLKKEWNRL